MQEFAFSLQPSSAAWRSSPNREAIFAGELSDLELARKHRELTALLGRLHLFPVSDEVILRARASFPLSVRALHAVHVATALQVFAEVDSLEFWTHDEASAAAAITAGLEVRGIRNAG